MDKYKNQYRIESNRLRERNYSEPGLYFITICTYNREPILGEIKNGVMSLSKTGEIVKEEWEKSFIIRTELLCDEFIIMPNHIHAILQIVETSGGTSPPGQIWMNNHYETSRRTSLQGGMTQNPDHKMVRITPKSISSFVGGFKSIATIRINKFQNTTGQQIWQTRFHDHVIRNMDEYERIKHYIRNNPKNFKPDKNSQ